MMYPAPPGSHIALPPEQVSPAIQYDAKPPLPEDGAPPEPAPKGCGKKRYVLCDTCCGCCCAVIGAVIMILAVVILAMFFNTWPATEFTNVKYEGPDGVELHAYVAKPKTPISGKAPAAIIFHAWNGMSEEPTYFADRLAEEGYYAIAPDLFRNMASDEGNIIRNIVNVVNAKQSRMNADADAALEYLRSQPEVDESKIVSGPGFCFGGSQSLVFASRHQTAGTVTCYGTYISELAADRSDETKWGKLGKNSPVLGIYGELDTRPSPKQAKSFRKALDAREVPHNVTIYPEVGHAFITPHAHRDSKHEGHEQAVTAWNEIVQFVRSVKDSGARRAGNTRVVGAVGSGSMSSRARATESHWNAAITEDRSFYHRAVCAFKCALDVLKGSGHFHHRALPTFGLDTLLANV